MGKVNDCVYGSNDLPYTTLDELESKVKTVLLSPKFVSGWYTVNHEAFGEGKYQETTRSAVWRREINNTQTK